MFNLEDIQFEESTYEEKNNRFQLVRSNNIGIDVIKYLMERLKNLSIEILNKKSGNIIHLMQNGALEGWCWQTTESAIVFFNDDDYIERGNLKFSNTYDYFHSWICFMYNGQEYVFDPCLNVLTFKELFDRVFEVEVQGKVSAKRVREEMIKQITTPVEREYSEETLKFVKYLEKILGENSRTKGETVCHGKEEINDPLFRNGVGYKAEIEGQKIKSLVAHYYLNG